MTKQKKLILFFICSAMFIVTAFGIVFYSQGYRIDFEKKRITQAGAFYFKANPSGTQIYINDKFTKRSDFLLNHFFLNNLVPRKYEVSIQKDGYFSWQKSLEVKEREVTEAKNIVLFKQSPSFTTLLQETNDFFFGKDKIATLEKKNSESLWELKIYDTKTNIKSHLLASSDLERLIPQSRNSIEFVSLAFSQNQNRILLSAKANNQYYNFLVNLETNPSSITLLNFKDQGVFFNPLDEQKIIYTEDSELLEFDNSAKTTSQLTEKALSFAINEANLYYLNEQGQVIRLNLSSKAETILNETTPLSGEYKIYAFSDLVFLLNDQGLFLFNSEEKEFEEVAAGNFRNIKISPDGQKLLYFSNNEISILFLKEQKSQPLKIKGDKIFLTRYSEEIGDASWLNSNYLIFNVQGKIKITEIDDRDIINIIDIADFAASKLKTYFNLIDRKIYILSPNSNFLVSSEPLL